MDFCGLLEDVEKLPRESVVVLHACCHNPTGVDLDAGGWSELLHAMKARQHIPFIYFAYQGFGEGVEKDAAVVRAFADAGLSFLISSSFSKSFSMCGERVGALTFVTQRKDESERVISQLKREIRVNYSNPPTFGAELVSTIVCDESLRSQWEAELDEMRLRISRMRNALVDGLVDLEAPREFNFIKEQRGMFSFSGLSVEQVGQLRSKYGVYALDSGRIFLAALNAKNIERAATAIASVLKAGRFPPLWHGR